MKKRQPNIELLRAIAMLMILILHANFAAIGRPSTELFCTNPFSYGLRVILQSFSIPGVDIFVLISGWFGIKQSFRGLFNLLWQVFFFVFGAYLLENIIWGYPLSLKDIISSVGLFDGGGWFVACYIGLFAVSPVLNAFIKESTIKQHFFLLIWFYSFQTLFGMTNSAYFIVGGYSTFSFIGLYLLAAFVKRVTQEKMYRLFDSKKFCTIGIIGCIILNSVIFTLSDLYGLIALRDVIFNYINPLVITQGVLTLLFFSNIKIENRLNSWINFIGSSCFAVYLLHVGTPLAVEFYRSVILKIITKESALLIVVLLPLFIFSVFAVAIILDQPRKLIWNKIFLPMFKSR